MTPASHVTNTGMAFNGDRTASLAAAGGVRAFRMFSFFIGFLFYFTVTNNYLRTGTHPVIVFCLAALAPPTK
jgi:hypothetical protein